MVGTVDMCMNCAVAAEGTRMKCPLCGEGMARVDSRAFQAMVLLRRKGYRPVDVKKRGFGKEKSIVVRFKGFSPGTGVHGEMKLSMEDGLAVCSTKSWDARRGHYQRLLEYVEEAERLESRVPYNRDLCSQCQNQYDEKWMHGVCSCPRLGMPGSSKPGPFGDTDMRKLLPKKCLYLVEQTVTRDEIIKDFMENYVNYPG